MQPSARKHASESHAARPRIALALAGTWFAVGCMALLLVPDLRGSDRREFKASIGSARSRARRAMLVRSTPSRRIRTPAPRAGRGRKTSLLTALFVRPV